jgi:hypothetical protein
MLSLTALPFEEAAARELRLPSSTRLRSQLVGNDNVPASGDRWDAAPACSATCFRPNGHGATHTPLTDLRPVMPRIALKPASLLRLRDASSCLCPAHDLADERKRPLGGVAVQRRRVPIVSPSDSTGQGSG